PDPPPPGASGSRDRLPPRCARRPPRGGFLPWRAVADWKPPTRRRLRAIRDKLRAEYGRPVPRPHRAPVDELVLTVLSQNTNDRNRDVAYSRLRERFESWDEVRDAPGEGIEDAIRPGGLAPRKPGRRQR